MANVTLPATGSVVKTDTVDTNVEIQYIKLMNGTAGSTDVITGDAANGIDVDVTRLPKLVSSTDIIGRVGIDQETANANEVVVKSGTVTAVTSITNAVTVNAHAVTNAGTFATQIDGAALTALQLIDNLAVAVDGNYLNVNCNIAGTDVAAGAGAVNAQTQRVTHASDDPVTTALQLLDNSVDGNYLNVNMNIAGTDIVGGAGAVAAGVQRVTHASDDPAVTALQLIDNMIAGNEAQVDVLTLPGVAGDVAHGTTDSGNPIKIGARVLTDPDGMTIEAAADRTDLLADEDGFLFVKPWTSNNDLLSERVVSTTDAETALTVFGATANCYNMITTITAYNSSTTACYCDLKDGTGGTIIHTIPLPAGGGAVIPFPVPLKQPTVNTALYYDLSATVSSVYLSFVGYKSKA